jgi:hypothetical protein
LTTPQPQPLPQPPPSNTPLQDDLKQNPNFADFVKYMGLKLSGTKKETKNGHAEHDSLNAENANSNEEDSGGFAEPEL